MSDEEIDAWFRVRRIGPTWHLDGGGFGGQAAGPLVEFPDTIEWFLFAEGSWLYLDAGVLDLGIVGDSASNARNDLQVFAETFEAAAYVGDAGSFRVTSTVEPTGAGAADVVPEELPA